ncbi:MAG TPA: hypothetical protein ENI27_02990 [bacterium]|nr:hypothetical protein [bacterium]
MGQQFKDIFSEKLDKEQRAEELIQLVVTNAANRLKSEYDRSEGTQGFVCAQVNPAYAGDRDRMYGMAKWFSNRATWEITRKMFCCDHDRPTG